MEQKLRIDEEFRNKIPPLTADEFKQLEENILSAGEVYQPIVTWNGIIVDGHNRWKIIQKHPEVKWRTREESFADKWEAFDWMYKNQLGRRNLTDEQRTMLIGKMYEARKKSVGEHIGNQHTKVECAQNEHIPKRISEQIASELGIGKETVKRAEQYAKGIDAIQKIDNELADSILTGGKKVNKKDVIEIGSLPVKEKKKAVESIKKGEKRAYKKATKEDREDYKQIRNLISETRTKTENTSSIDELLNAIRTNCTPHIRLLNSIIDGYASVIHNNSTLVIEVIEECIDAEIMKIKEKIKNEYA